MDYNPVSIKQGSLVAHEAQWLGGNSNCLPFASDTFDYTIANAALHHMNDIPGSILEMYRVTKPGGHIFLISDPFSKSVADDREHELDELNIFDRHPMVMNGVNEGVIPFNRYLSAISSLDADAKLLTMKVNGLAECADSPCYWSIDDRSRDLLSSRSGNISAVMRVGTDTLTAPLMGAEEIPTDRFFDSIGDPRQSISFLLPYIARKQFDRFPFQASSKFLLMNGWHTMQDVDKP